MAHEREPPQIANRNDDDRQDKRELDAAVIVKLHEEPDVPQHGRNENTADHGHEDSRRESQRTIPDDPAIAEFLRQILMTPEIEQHQNRRRRRRYGTTDGHHLQKQGPFGNPGTASSERGRPSTMSP